MKSCTHNRRFSCGRTSARTCSTRTERVALAHRYDAMWPACFAQAGLHWYPALAGRDPLGGPETPIELVQVASSTSTVEPTSGTLPSGPGTRMAADRAVPAAAATAGPATTADLREATNAILRDSGLLRAISTHPVMAAREPEGREAGPTAAVIDSQPRESRLFSRRLANIRGGGEVAERSKAHPCLGCRRGTVSRVRIPSSPPIPCILTTSRSREARNRGLSLGFLPHSCPPAAGSMAAGMWGRMWGINDGRRGLRVPAARQAGRAAL